MDERDLGTQSFRHRVAVSLICWIEFVAKRFFRFIEGANQKSRLPFIAKVGQVAKKAVDGAYFLPGRPGHRRHSMKDLVDEAMRIDQDHQVFGGERTGNHRTRNPSVLLVQAFDCFDSGRAIVRGES